ncbi:MAG TPA: hydrogenase formation protein HypD [Thermoanaerobaculaceae bacterium]|nr:hydrogenase formation protein HypD [Thermoanaerobaculaceae bacterium]
MSAESALAAPATVRGLLRRVERLAGRLPRRVTLMEVCGTHTHAIAAAGLRRLLPANVRLIAGPGCPVCVTPVDYVDRAEALARRPATVVATFGDLLRVPSTSGSLERARAEGVCVRVVYSPRDALRLARDDPDRTVVFLAVGFETTSPTVAAALAEAEADGVPNFLVLSGHKAMPPPLRLLAGDREAGIDGFLLPGHVAVVTGSDAFSFLAEEFHLPAAVVGFTPTDVLRGVAALVDMLGRGEPEVVNLYSRVVRPDGNAVARALVQRFFAAAACTWRGLGAISASGLALRPELARRDAAALEVELPTPCEPEGCRCGDVLRGRIDPPECPLFGSACTPAAAVGACMVSSEGSCAAFYRHERLAGVRP